MALDDVQLIGVTDSEVERAMLETDDLLVVEGNGSQDQIGRVALWDGRISPCLHQNHIIKIRLAGLIQPEYVLYWMLSPNGREKIIELAGSSSGLYTLSISKVSSIAVPLPPLEEQKRITSEIEARISTAENQERIASTAITRSARLRQSILRRAFAGELVPQDRSDEPASVLLERIRAEREAALSQPKLPRPKRVKDEQAVKAKERRPLYDVLKTAGKPLKPEDLFRQAGFDAEFDAEDVEAFYEELVQEVDQRIDVVRPNKDDVYIKLKVTKP